MTADRSGVVLRYSAGQRYRYIDRLKNGLPVYVDTHISTVSETKLWLANGKQVELVEGPERDVKKRRQ